MKSRVAMIAVVALFTVNCLGDQTVVELTPSSLWEGVLIPTQEVGDSLPRVTGQVAVVVRSVGSVVGMGLQPVDIELSWGVFEGGCEAPGAPLLDAARYPVIPEQTEDFQVTLPAILSTSESYSVRLSTAESQPTLLACSDLELVPENEVD